MTCVIGLVEKRPGKRVVYIGGDSAALSVPDLDIQLRVDTKVFRNRDVIMGFTDSFRMGQILRYHFTPPLRDPAVDVFEYMVRDFIEGVRVVLRDCGYAMVRDNVESGGTFLVGVAGRLFYVDAGYQVAELLTPYVAIGCGSPYALGALYATRDTTMTPERRIELALAAAEFHNAGVRSPFHVINLEYPDGS